MTEVNTSNALLQCLSIVTKHIQLTLFLPTSTCQWGEMQQVPRGEVETQTQSAAGRGYRRQQNHAHETRPSHRHCVCNYVNLHKHAGHRRQTTAQPGEGARRRNQLPRRQVPKPGFRVSAEQLPGKRASVRR